MSLHEFMVKETFKKPARCMKIKSHPPSIFYMIFMAAKPPEARSQQAIWSPGTPGPRHERHSWRTKAPGEGPWLYIDMYLGRPNSHRGRAAYP